MFQSRRATGNRVYLLLILVTTCALLLCLLYISLMLLSSSTPPSPTRVVLISTTSYPSTSDLRFTLALRTAQQARLHSIPLLIIDSSTPDIQAALRNEGAIVLPEDPASMGGQGKGFAYRYGIRQAMQRAPALFGPHADDFVLCISEPEKVDFVRFLPALAARLLPDATAGPSSTAGVLLPHRSASAFLSLPVEQRHSEQFANLHLHNAQRELTPPLSSFPIDYLFGPVLFHCYLSGWWLSNASPLWDAQIVPYIEAAYSGQARLLSVEVDYIHPREQTAEEEGKAVWSAKRFMQLEKVIPALEKAMKAAAAKAAQAK